MDYLIIHVHHHKNVPVTNVRTVNIHQEVQKLKIVIGPKEKNHLIMKNVGTQLHQIYQHVMHQL